MGKKRQTKKNRKKKRWPGSNSRPQTQKAPKQFGPVAFFFVRKKGIVLHTARSAPKLG